MTTPKPTVTIITAQSLKSDQKKSITKLLESKLGHDVQIQEQVDTEVLGGVLVKIGEQTFDASVAGKLEKIESQLPQLQIVSPIELDAKTIKRIESKVRDLYGQSIGINIMVNPDLVGGVQVRFGSQEYDSSVRTKLEKLQLHLSQAITI
ncbi:ATPase, F1 complex, OSCP/delta subunit [sediment metagenome]|uniref:ATPase, F1 complex, OSCP/delta subunit n=1 Tax=sediment metagenome TaxID=749907 RepID=D9PIV8_9ZZZZ